MSKTLYRISSWLLPALFCASSLAAQAPAPTTTANYEIGPEDRLRIAIWGQNDISGDYQVERDGTFTFPLIGRVSAGGLTVEKLEKELRRRLADGYYRDPQVTVSVQEYRSKRVFVMGALRSPGTYPITGETNLVELLAKAGSPTAEAADHALVIRAGTEAVADEADPSSHVTRVDLKRLIAGELPAEYVIGDGDTIYVPQAATVFVYGQVRNPGSFEVAQDTTVRQAISLAGGLTEYGAANRIKILRVVNGEEQSLKVKMHDLVQPGDTLVVPVRFF